jgi:hypothetical protein
MRPWLISALADGRVEQHVVYLVLPELLERLPGEGLDVAQVAQLERQHGDGVGGAVVGEGVVGLLGALRVAGAEDDSIGRGLLKELADGLEAL